MNREIMDQIIDEIIKNDRRAGTGALREPSHPARETAWRSWVPEIARKSPGEALASLGSGWRGLAQPAVEERLKVWGPNRLPPSKRSSGSLLGWIRPTSAKRLPGPSYVLRSSPPGDTRPQWIPPDQLTPGDLVLLSAGDLVPADVRLLRVRDFRVDERILTGNGKAVPKTSRWESETSGPFGITDVAYGGTQVVTGTATGVVVATGDRMLLAILGRA